MKKCDFVIRHSDQLVHTACIHWTTSIHHPTTATNFTQQRWQSNRKSKVRFTLKTDNTRQTNYRNKCHLLLQSFPGNEQHTKQAGWFSRPDCDPSSECPRASIAVRRRAAGSIRISRRASCCCSSAIAGIAIGANFTIYLLRQFCSNRVHFLQYTGDTDAKMMDQNFEIRIVIFENYLKFSKRRRAVPLQPIWTIMVAAELL